MGTNRLVWGVGRNKVKPKHGAEQDDPENEAEVRTADWVA